MVLEVEMVEAEQALVQVCFEAVLQEACNTAAAAAVAVVIFGEVKQVQAEGWVHLRCSHSSYALEQESRPAPRHVGNETRRMNLSTQVEASPAPSGYQLALVCL